MLQPGRWRDTWTPPPHSRRLMLRLAPPLVEAIIEHAWEAHPHECCGMVAGRDSLPSHLYRIKNTDPNPASRYLMDVREQLWAFRNMRHNGLDLVAIYHSHPLGPAYPSLTDVSLAFYPDAYYLLASLENPRHPVLRAFRIASGTFNQEALEVG